jgi:hypothetical protein
LTARVGRTALTRTTYPLPRSDAQNPTATLVALIRCCGSTGTPAQR